MNREIEAAVYEALGEASALFMSQEVKGTEIVMPTRELESIGSKLLIVLHEYGEQYTEMKQQMHHQYLDAVASLSKSQRDTWAEQWVEDRHKAFERSNQN